MFRILFLYKLPFPLGPGHTAADFFDYHQFRQHSATVIKVTVAECGRFLSRQPESIICPKGQIINSASSCISVSLGIFFEMRTARSGWRNQSCNFTWVCLKKKLAQIENAFGRGFWSSGFRSSWRKQPGSLVSFFGLSAIVAKRGKNKKTPPVALVGSVAALLERTFESLASRRTASVLTGLRKFVDIFGWTERAKSGFILQWWFASYTSLERARRERSGELSRDRVVHHLPNYTSTQLSLPRWSAVSSHRAWTHRVCLEWIWEKEREREREREWERER